MMANHSDQLTAICPTEVVHLYKLVVGVGIQAYYEMSSMLLNFSEI